MNRLANSWVRSAAADIPAHGFVNVFVGWFGFFRQQHRGAHDLSGLAVAALRHVQLNPRFLQRMREIRGQSFDGRHVLAFDARYRRHAGANRLAVQVHGARSAQRHPATEFRPGHPQRLPQHPQQRSRGIHVHLDQLSIYEKTCHLRSPLLFLDTSSAS